MWRFFIDPCKHLQMSILHLIVIFGFCVLVSVAEDASASTATPSDLMKLKNDLLKNYDKDKRPSVNYLIPTNVTMLFDVKHVIEMEEKMQILKVRGILMLRWNDDHMVWDPKDYGGINAVRFSNDKVWKPDIVSIFSTQNSADTDRYSSVIAFSSGIVKWFPMVSLSAPCSTRLRHYPFDQHNCTLKFGSWTHSGETVVLQTFDFPLNTNEVVTTTEWRLLNVSNENEVFRSGKYFTYYMVRVEIYLQRASKIYRYVCVVPTLLAVLSTLSAFWLRFSEASRYILGCSNILMMTLLLLHLTSTIPFGNEMPIIAEYSASCLCMSFIFLLITVAVTAVSRCSTRAPPSSLVRFCRNVLNRGLCLSLFVQSTTTKNYNNMVAQTTESMTSFDERLMRAGDWLILALVIDRVSFWIFSLVYLVLICVLASI